MSVPKNKRGLSKMEFYNNARKPRENITGILLPDFGARGKNIKTEKTDNCEITVIEGYPDRFVAGFRRNILRRLRRQPPAVLPAGGF